MGSLTEIVVAALATLVCAAIAGLVKLYGDVREMRAQQREQEKALGSLPRLTAVLDRLSGTMEEFQKTFREMGREQQELVKRVAFLAGAEHGKQLSDET